MLKVSIQLEYEGDSLATVQKAVCWLINTLRRQKPECVNQILHEFKLTRCELSDLFRRLILVDDNIVLQVTESDARLFWSIAKMVFDYLKIKEESLPGLLFKPILKDLDQLMNVNLERV